MSKSSDVFPEAAVRSESGFRSWLRDASGWVWLIVLVCFFTAAALSWRAMANRGTLVSIHFLDGHGLQPKDALRYRGITVGVVEFVQLRDGLDGVDVKIRLKPDAEPLAREGSRFWIERPQLSLNRLSGLETVVGAKYVGVIPGDASGSVALEFEGLESPPTIRGPSKITVRIEFRDGHGIAAGDRVKFRGITVGEVTSVRLDDQMRKVLVEARLVPSAETLARTGTLFWVERPKVSLQGVRGLDTLVGGQYLAAIPDPAAEQSRFEFEGVEEPPPVINPQDGGLLLTLEADEQYGLARGASLSYRGVSVGQVLQVALSPNGQNVAMSVVIFPSYVALVRENTRFWSQSGVDVHVGFRGLEVDMAPLSSLAAAEIAFATPEPAGRPVGLGHRFSLLGKAPESWREWEPNLDARRADSTASQGASRRLLDRFKERFGSDDR